MTAQRFVGANSREAMNRVRLVLGDDALILSSRMTDEGVEIMALAEEMPAQAGAPAVADDDSLLPVSPHLAAAAYARQTETLLAPAPARPQAPAPAQPQPAVPSAAQDFAALSERLLKEIHDMRQLIDQGGRAVPQTVPGRNDAHTGLLKRLLDAGFSNTLADPLLAGAPLFDAQFNSQRQQDWLLHRLGNQLQHLQSDEALFAEAGIIALVGPTGVGKTTTTAKLAARYVMRHGPQGVALVSTDSFRIGAHEQLRIYARLLGVQLHTLTPSQPLEQLLASLSDKHLVIIDTVGMSQRDQRLVTQINQLGASQRRLRLMLVLNAASHGDTLEEVLHTYRDAARNAGCTLNDCIISKCDEAVRLGPVLDIAIRHALRINYLSVGQQVPEDLQLPEPAKLLQQALDVSRPSSFAAHVGKAAGQSTGQRLDALVRGLLGQSRNLASLREHLSQDLDGFAALLQAWPLRHLQPALQARQCPALTDADPDTVAGQSGGLLLWGAARPGAGVTWNMPLLRIDHNHRLQARPWLAHRLPIGAAARLGWSQAHWPEHRHLWPQCPPREMLDALGQSGQAWLAQIKGAQQVMHHQQRQRLDSLAGQAEEAGVQQLLYQSRSARLSLRCLPVTLQRHPAQPLRAWFGTLQDNQSGQPLGQRYWLADTHGSAHEQMASLLAQLRHDSLPALTRHAWKLLGEIQPNLNAELRLLLASGLAASALHLTHADDERGFQARTQLLGLMPVKRSASPSALVEGLLHLLAVSDAFERMHNASAA